MAGDLKKESDVESLRRAGEKVLGAGSGFVGPVSRPSSAPLPASGKRERGRQPGTKFPEGYKKNKEQRENQDLPPQDSRVKNSVSLFVENFSSILAEKRGEFWKLSEKEVEMLSAPLSEIVDEIMPGMLADKWGYRLSMIGLVVGPRIMQDLKVNSKKKGVVQDVRTGQPEQSQPAERKSDQPSKREFDAGAGVEGAWKNNLAKYDPEKDAAGCGA